MEWSAVTSSLYPLKCWLLISMKIIWKSLHFHGRWHDMTAWNFVNFIWLVVFTILTHISQWGRDDIPYIMENKSHVWNQQPVIDFPTVPHDHQPTSRIPLDCRAAAPCFAAADWFGHRNRNPGDNSSPRVTLLGLARHRAVICWSGCQRNWLVVEPPLWKMMEFVSWDDYPLVN